jgi:NAD(P)-dependent dehydrogenase (short-subunit alcohol dehydrogenase family)
VHTKPNLQTLPHLTLISIIQGTSAKKNNPFHSLYQRIYLEGPAKSSKMVSLDRINPYGAVHDNPQGPGDARPTALQIIADNNLVNALPDATVLVTGGSSGIGIETARAMHATGARVFITTRNIPAAQLETSEILASGPSKRPIEIVEMELDSLESVRNAASEVLKRTDRLNILINNAGVMAVPEGKTKDGFETHFGVNYLAHFLLTSLLLPTLVASSTPTFASRIVNVSSLGHHYAVGGFTNDVFDDLDFSKTKYNEWTAYGRSKLAQILHANEVERRYGSSSEHPVHAFSLHPGGITTNLWRYSEDARLHIPKATDSDPNKALVGRRWKSPEQGAATSVWCAVAKDLEGRKGTYCENCAESQEDGPDTLFSRGDPGHAKWINDTVAEARLWSISGRMVEKWF